MKKLIKSLSLLRHLGKLRGHRHHAGASCTRYRHAHDYHPLHARSGRAGRVRDALRTLLGRRGY